jgi:ABC-2 type transport system ATP-binding protein
MLVAADLRKRFNATPALQGFTMTVQRGEVCGLIGHNGAGKTTFARIIAGLTRPDAGRALVCDLDVIRERRRTRQRLGYAPQELALYPTATVRENLRLFGGLSGLRRAQLRREIDAVAEAMHLEPTLDHPVKDLSGGQQRRVQTASALIHRPDVLFLDEPTVGADPITRSAVLATVRERADDGAAICYTTHILAELEELDATIAVAARGRILARGARRDLLRRTPGTILLSFDGPVPQPLAVASAGAPRVVQGDTLRIRAPQPSDVLAALMRDMPLLQAQLRTVELQQPSLDDLYRSLNEELVDDGR